MNEQEMINRFHTLFRGNGQAYGGDEGRAIWKPVSAETFANHLYGIEPIGIYPIQHWRTGLNVGWGCCDIDTGDWQEAWMLYSALKGMGLNPWVERSRSKGWHIWVLADIPVSPAEMRRCLKVAYAAIDLPAKEANPKQETLAPNQLGNYVRLPYKGGMIVRSVRQTMMDPYWLSSQNDGYPLTFQEFIKRDDLFSDYSVILKWAAKWYEPPRARTNITLGAIDPQIAQLVPSGWRHTWDTGDVKDRSATFVAMAYDLAKNGMQPQQVFDILWACPWNKYVDRAGGEVYVQDIVDRAFT